jgi:hypothetical protein
MTVGGDRGWTHASHSQRPRATRWWTGSHPLARAPLASRPSRCAVAPRALTRGTRARASPPDRRLSRWSSRPTGWHPWGDDVSADSQPRRPPPPGRPSGQGRGRRTATRTDGRATSYGRPAACRPEPTHAPEGRTEAGVVAERDRRPLRRERGPRTLVSNGAGVYACCRCCGFVGGLEARGSRATSDAQTAPRTTVLDRVGGAG